MDCLTTTNLYKINKNKKIGNVVIIVEGEYPEKDLLKKIFNDILGYKLVIKTRNEKYKEYCSYNNEELGSQVIVINAEQSNIKFIKDDNNFVTNTLQILYEQYGIDIHNKRVYYLWDRDEKSNTDKRLISSLCLNFNNAYETDNGLGFLLLSYPQIESYIISMKENDVFKLKIKDFKKYVKKENTIQKMKKTDLIKALVEMHKTFNSLNIKYYDIDNFSSISVKIFEEQEKYFYNFNTYRILSMLSLLLLDLQIIGEK